MNHNPYEDWIFAEDLEKEQRGQLNAHLDQCESCRSMADAHAQTNRLFTNPASAMPSAGFTLRWVDYATRRQAVEQKRQVQLVFGLLAGFTLISMAVLMYVYFMQGISLTQVFSDAVFNILEAIQRAVIMVQSYRFVITVLPFRIPGFVWGFLGINLVFWAAFWTLSIWKFASIKRVAL